MKACKDAGKDADHFLCAGYDAAQALFGALRETTGDAANKERLIQIITDMKIDSPRGALRFDPKNHNPISDIHMRTVAGQSAAARRDRRAERRPPSRRRRPRPVSRSLRSIERPEATRQ